MAGHEMLDGLGREEFEVKHPAEGEDHDETVDALGGDFAGIGPVDLGLLPWGGLNVEKGFWGEPQGPEVISKDADASRVAKFLDLFVDTHGAHHGVMIQKFTDLILEEIELGGPWRRRSWREGLLLQGPSHGFGVDPQLSGNGLLAEFFDVVKVSDGSPGFDFHFSTS